MIVWAGKVLPGPAWTRKLYNVKSDPGESWGQGMDERV